MPGSGIGLTEAPERPSSNEVHVSAERVHIPRFQPEKPRGTPPGLGWRQGVILGLGLSFTNIANGFGATVAGTAPLRPVMAAITVWGYVMIWLSNIGIGLIAKILGRYAPLVGGLVLDRRRSPRSPRSRPGAAWSGR